MIALWFIGAALAADVDLFPRIAEVDLPERGAARIHVPPGLRSAADPADGSDLLLLDRNGKPVPFARLDQDARWEAPAVPVTGIATVTPMLWTVDLGPTPVDGLRVSLPGPQAAATVTVQDLRGTPLSEPTLVWRLAGQQQEVVPLERSRAGLLRVRVVPHAEGLLSAPRVSGLRLTDAGVPPDRVRWAPSAPRLQDNGWVRYDLELDQPLPVRAVHLHPRERVVQRRASLQAAPEHEQAGALPWELSPASHSTLERVALEGVVIENLMVPLTGAPSDRLALLVDGGPDPLVLDEVELELAGVHLLVTDPGPGPHRLYAGALPGTTAVYDLAAAIPELARAAGAAVEPGAPRSNPAWVPPEERGELGAPGNALPMDGFAERRAVQGAGLSRLVLPLEVLAGSREDLGDVRLEAGGHEVPYVRRRRSEEVVLPVGAWTTHRRDGQTLLEIPIDDPMVPLSSITLHTEAPVFARRISLARRRGSELQVLRAATWNGTGHDTALTLELGQRVGDTLVVTIHDGDNPPLPIEGIELRAPSWELVALIPSDVDVHLLTGDRDRRAAVYDLALVREQLRHRPLAEATLGPPQELVTPPLSWLDRLFVAGGLGVLCLGLLGLLADLLRRVPDEAEHEPAEPALV